MKKYYIELGSITGKRIYFWMPYGRDWKRMLTDEELQYWGLEKIHHEKPDNLPEWDCKKSLMELL